jgi:hypothetical protein
MRLLFEGFVLGCRCNPKNVRVFSCRWRHICAAQPLAIPFCPLSVFIFVILPTIKVEKEAPLSTFQYVVSTTFFRNFSNSQKNFEKSIRSCVIFSTQSLNAWFPIVLQKSFQRKEIFFGYRISDFHPANSLAFFRCFILA